MAHSATEAVREGTWWPPRPDRLPVLALLAVLADLAVTVAADGLAFPAAGREWGPLAGGVVLVAGKFVLLAVAWLRFGPVSTYVGVYLVVTAGLDGGAMGALALLGSGDPLAALPTPVRYLIAPALATVAGVALVDVLRRDPPWGEVGLVAAALLLAEADLVVASLALGEFLA